MCTKEEVLVGSGGGDEGVALTNSDAESIASFKSERKLGLQKWHVDDWVPFPFNKFMSRHVYNGVVLLGPAHVLGLYGAYLGWTGVTPSFWTGFLFRKLNTKWLIEGSND